MSDSRESFERSLVRRGASERPMADRDEDAERLAYNYNVTKKEMLSIKKILKAGGILAYLREEEQRLVERRNECYAKLDAGPVEQPADPDDRRLFETSYEHDLAVRAEDDLHNLRWIVRELSGKDGLLRVGNEGQPRSVSPTLVADAVKDLFDQEAHSLVDRIGSESLTSPTRYDLRRHKMLRRLLMVARMAAVWGFWSESEPLDEEG